MENKKSEKANLQNKKGLFLELGVVASLAFVLLAFNWTTTEKRVSLLQNTSIYITEEEIPITHVNPIPPKEIPPIPQVSDVIEIVEVPVFNPVILPNVEDTKTGVIQIDYVNTTVIKPKEEVFVEESIPFPMVEVKPTFGGGDANTFSKWVNSRIVYPAAAQETNISGIVYLSFDVGIDGVLTNLKVLRGVDPLLDQEAIRVVKLSPRWEPGRQQGKAVKVSYQFPVKFQLN